MRVYHSLGEPEVRMRVAVIGAGPAGLTTLKYLKLAHEHFQIEPIEVQLFEREADIGGTFQYRVYEDAELVSSKYLTAFSDFRFAADAPDFVTPEKYVRYLEDYCSKFRLWSHVQCASEVLRVQRNEKGGHNLTVRHDGVTTDHVFDAVAICSGLHTHPSIPVIPGIEKVGQTLHSSEFKSHSQFQDKRNGTVVVLGTGETGMDIGHIAVTTPGVGAVVVCHKEGFLCAPKTVPEPILFGFLGKRDSRPPKPLDTCVASLFDSAYAHPEIQRGTKIWEYYTWVIQFLMFIVTGTYGGMHQWVGLMSKERRHGDGIFFCKSTKAIPYISAPYHQPSFWNRIRAMLINVAIPDTRGLHIDLAPWPTHVDDKGVMHFANTGSPESQKVGAMTIKPDVVVFATGYQMSFPFLDETYGTPNTADVRLVYHSDDISTAFIGFVRPSFGAIPPLAEMQAQLWVARLVQSFQLTSVPFRGCTLQGLSAEYNHRYPDVVTAYELDWRLHARGGRDLFSDKRGVDHDSYVYQLALDLGSAPTFSFVRRQGFRALWTWAMGSNFNTKFRLVGPWRDPEMALSIMRGELYDVTRRLGGLFFFTLYTLVPLVVFGSMSLLLYTRDGVRRVRGWRGVKRTMEC